MATPDIEVGKVHTARDGEAMRVLVDRLWPRGVSKERADLDEWAKDTSPSTDLRKEFHGGDLSFEQFADRYRAELADGDGADGLEKLAETVCGADGRVLLLIAGDPTGDNHAQVLAQALREQIGESS
ncbi:DUF488 family protein [Dermacoccus sp. PAMC28757]|uniref:DUF488 domain-containing protein n=1 Tax=Dermacoccus sp. PAMC28757 TaxID=2762331 RepID=UPI00164D1506|nr:DUF488 family protein [Dermacoccus sp. PAMC28757]QNK53605.1 DUF488 family protein [Dermacoccus sp. PAMC28757]